MADKKIDKTISIVAFTLITAAIVIAHNSPAQGYEASIYESTPISVWILLMLSTLCGIYLTVSSLFGKNENSRFAILGISIAGLSAAVLLLVFALRGYYLIGIDADTSRHMYFVNYLLTWGHSGSANYYPMLHYYVAALYDLTGISVVNIFKYLPVFFEVFFMASIYLLASTVLPLKKQALLAVLAGIPLINTASWVYLYLYPDFLFTMLFPFIFWVVLRSLGKREFTFTGLAVVLVICAAVIHPLSVATIILLLLGVWLFQRFKAPFPGPKSHLKRFASSQNLILLSAIVGSGWIIHFRIYGANVREVLAGAFHGSVADLYTERLIVASGVGYNIYVQFLKLNGAITIYLVLSLIAFVVVWTRLSRGEADLFKLKGLFGGFLLIAVIEAPILLISPYGPLRAVAFLVILSAVFVGFLLFEFNRWLVSSKKRRKTIGVALACLLLLSVSASGMLDLYRSPFTLSMTRQTTYAEVYGYHWFLTKKSLKDYSAMLVEPQKFLYLLPITKAAYVTQEMAMRGEQQQLPLHFGYTNHSQVGDVFSNSTYIILTKQSERLFVDVYPQLASQRYSPQDYAQFANDTTANKVYSNGGLDVWSVTANGAR